MCQAFANSKINKEKEVSLRWQFADGKFRVGGLPFCRQLSCSGRGIHSIGTMADYLMTIDSDVEDSPLPKFTKAVQPETENAHLNTEFTFDIEGDPYTDIFGYQKDVVKKGTKPVSEPGSVYAT